MAQIWEVDNAAYHADTEKIGSTGLKCLLSSPQDYYDLYVAKTRKVEQTPSMLFGSLVHCLVLEPQEFDKVYFRLPEGHDARTKAGKEFLEKNIIPMFGKTPIKFDLYEQANRMATAVLANPLVQELTEGAIKERAIVWEEDDIVQKCKPDWFMECPSVDSDLHLDLKSSGDPTPENWGRTGAFGPIQSFGYDLQVASHYPAGISALTGRPCRSGLVVVGDDPPHDVFVYNITPYWQTGAIKRQRALAILRQCRETGVWQREEQQRIIDLEPSKWDLPNGGE